VGDGISIYRQLDRVVARWKSDTQASDCIDSTEWTIRHRISLVPLRWAHLLSGTCRAADLAMVPLVGPTMAALVCRGRVRWRQNGHYLSWAGTGRHPRRSITRRPEPPESPNEQRSGDSC
jgi:hypothetical protein